MRCIILLLMLNVVFNTNIQAQKAITLKEIKGAGVANVVRMGSYQVIDSKGNIYLAGYFEGKANFDLNTPEKLLESTLSKNGKQNTEDAFLVKYNANYEMQWLHTFGNQYDIRILNLKVDNQDNIYIVGRFRGEINLALGEDEFKLNSEKESMFMAKYNETGKLTLAFDTKIRYDGQPLWAQPLAMSIDKQQNIYLAGRNYGIKDFDPTEKERKIKECYSSNGHFIVKYNKEGKLALAQNINCNNGKGGEIKINDMTVDEQENIYIAGQFRGEEVDFSSNGQKKKLLKSNYGGGQYSPGYEPDAFVAKYNASGTVKWVKTYGLEISGNNITRQDREELNAVKVKNGTVYVAGHLYYKFKTLTESTGIKNGVFLLKLNPETGQELFKKLYKNNAITHDSFLVYDFDIDKQGNMILVGMCRAGTSYTSKHYITGLKPSGWGIFVAKHNSKGEVVWVTSANGKGWATAYDLNVKNNKIYVSGHYRGIKNFSYTEKGNRANDLILVQEKKKNKVKFSLKVNKSKKPCNIFMVEYQDD